MIDALGGVSSGSVQGLDRRVGPGIVLGSTAVCVVAAVIASAAFVLGSRRQLRSVGLLATIGADPAAIRAAMVLQGTIPGLAAGVLAVGVGVVGTAIANRMDVMEHLTDVAGARYQLSLGGGLLAVALGMLAGIIAAWQPARAASRAPVLSALGGRRPAHPVESKLPIGGLALWIVGGLAVALGSRAERRPFGIVLPTLAAWVRTARRTPRDLVVPRW